jgi:hypothetical protein
MTTFDYDEYVSQHSAPIHNIYESAWKDYELLCDLVAGQVRIPVWYLDEFTRRPGQLPAWLENGKEASDE